MLTVILSVAMAAEPAAGAKPPLRLGAPGLSSTGLSADESRFFSEHLAQELSLAGVAITTPAEIASVLGLERQKQLLGCGDSSCSAEIGAALGVDGLVTGTVAKVGGAFQVNVKVVSAANGATLSVASVRADSDKALLDELSRLARALAAELFAKLDRAPVKSAAAESLESGKVRRLSWIPAAVGVLAAGAAVYFTFDARSRFDTLRNAGNVNGDAVRFKQQGQLSETLAWTFGVVGGAGLVAGGLMFLLGGPKEVPVALLPIDGGALVLFSLGGGQP